MTTTTPGQLTSIFWTGITRNRVVDSPMLQSPPVTTAVAISKATCSSFCHLNALTNLPVPISIEIPSVRTTTGDKFFFLDKLLMIYQILHVIIDFFFYSLRSSKFCTNLPAFICVTYHCSQILLTHI